MDEMRAYPIRLLLLAGAFCALATAVLGVVVAPRHSVPGLWAIAISAFFASGAWAVTRSPDSLAARRLLVVGVVATAWYALGMVELLRHDATGSGNGLWALNAVVLGLDIALPASVMTLLATFPSGAAASRPRRGLVGAGWALAAALPLTSLLLGRDQIPAYVLVWNEGLTSLPGPGGTSLPHGVREVLVALHESALALLVLLGAVVLAFRYRRVGSRDRIRMKWVALAGFLIALDGVFTGVPAINVIPAFISIPLIGLFPVLVAIGIAHPDVLDVGQALRRSALFGLLWAGASILYVGLAGSMGVAAEASRGAASAVPVTLAATLAFYPVWQAVLRRVSRRLRGSGLDGDELLRRLGQALEHTLEPQSLARALASTVRDGLGVSWVRITLDGEAVAAVGIPLVGVREPALSTDLVFEGEVLGRIECGPRIRGALYAADRERLHALGSQVGLAAHNARLAARIVKAEELGRRRIERDIHDGIQQDLVALIAQIGLAEAQLRRDPERSRVTLAALRDDAGRALADLRELASGIHPSVLGDRGIVDAIEARAARLQIGVTIESADDLRGVRFPETVEGAVYFTICEALTNAVKHSRAADVIVRISRRDDVLEVEVSDNGDGFVVAHSSGTGLAGLADRLQALRGSFAIESTPGVGTTVRATLPVTAEALHV
jgi:signal transduction histidine kinase